MADDWNTVTHIGKSRSGGNGGGQRQKVVNKRSDLNAAFRAGGVSTEKKATSANSKSNPEGQRARKIDDADGPVAIVKNNTDLANAVQLGMRKRKINASQLALKIYEKPDVIRKILNKDAAKPSTNILVKMEKELGVKLLGKDNLGEPTEKGKKMDEEDEAARKAEEAKEAKQAKEAEEAKEGEEAEETAAKSEIAETQEA